MKLLSARTGAAARPGGAGPAELAWSGDAYQAGQEHQTSTPGHPLRHHARAAVAGENVRQVREDQSGPAGMPELLSTR